MEVALTLLPNPELLVVQRWAVAVVAQALALI
jgi:hypothetical protein